MSFYGGLSKDHLVQFVERIERLEEEKANVQNDLKELFAEAKSNGFDVKTLKHIVKLRKMDDDKRDEEEYLIDTYKRAVGLLPELDEEEAEAPKEEIRLAS